jgi:hypothetical protein
MNHRTLRACVLAALGCAVPAGAHHAIGMFDISTPVWVKVSVVRYEPREPHVLIFVEQKTADGRSRSLTIEGPIMSRLRRMNLARDFIEPGDVIEICGFPFRKDVLAERGVLPDGVGALPALHAQLLVLPDGRRQPWGPYGKLDNCVRPGDTAQAWALFVDGAPMAREYWCKGLAYSSVPSVAPKALVEEVNRRMASPCD